MKNYEYPTLQIAIEKLEKLIEGKLTVEEVSDYGSYWLREDEKSDTLKEVSVVKAMDLLSAVDMPTTDRRYLYGNEDFKDWISEMKAKL